MPAPSPQPMLTFKAPNVEREYKTSIHPDLRLLLVELGQYSRDRNLPPPCVTQLYRTPEENVTIYVNWWKALQLKMAELAKIPALGYATVIPSMFGTTANYELARGLVGLSDEQLEQKAKARMTLHSWFAAADLRQWHYSHFQKDIVWQWLVKRCDVKDWERREDLHGSGPHFHIGRKDAAWIQKQKDNFSSQHKAANSNA